MSVTKVKIALCLVLLGGILACKVDAQERGYIIEEETTTPPLFGIPGGTGLTKTWMTKDKLRRDEGGKEQTTIIRSDIGKIWLIDHSDTTYNEMSRETFQGLAMMGLMMFGVTTDSATGKPIIPDPLFQRTGRAKKVQDWTCHELVVGSREGFFGKMVERFSMWVSRETGLEQGLYGRMMKKMMGELGGEYESFFRQLEEIDGYPVLVETKAMGLEMIQKLKKFERCPIPASVFELPEGYKKINGLFSE